MEIYIPTELLASTIGRNGGHQSLFPKGGACVLLVILFQNGGLRSAVASAEAKKYLIRRNASTNGRKTDLIERYILHRKPKHKIYVHYFSILLYLLNVQVASTENITS